MIRRFGLIGLIGVAGLTVHGSAEEFPPLFPFLISYDGPDNASSMAHLLDAPAGRGGFIRVEDGHFVNDKGRVRLNATNLTGPANFPTHEASDKLAARLARFGINCVRLHYFDSEYGGHLPEPITQTAGIFGDKPASQRVLDPGQVDRQDYMIAAFKKRGIYVDINLHVARTMDERDGFVNVKGKPWADNGLNNFDPRLIALQKEYAKDLLTRVNPYTGLTYADDPCVAVVEINNENAMLCYYHHLNWLDRLSEPYAGELRRQWNAWLKKQYTTTETVKAAWKWAPVPLRDEQIPEGGFSRPVTFGSTAWTLAKGTAAATCAAGNGVLALDVTRDADSMFPKLFRRVTVKKGQPYTLSFKIRRTRGAGSEPLGFAVADTKGGWRPLGVLTTIPVSTNWSTVTRVFDAGDDSGAAEVQLTRFAEGRYEIDDFSFQSGAAGGYDLSGRIEDGTAPIIKSEAYAPEQARRDFYQFIIDTERAFWTGMRDYIRNGLKVKALVAGTQIDYSPPHVQAELDFVDKHGYWCHPSSVKREEWRIGNTAMVNSMSTPAGMASLRVHNKPYTVSECNAPFPNQYGAEFQPMMRAYGALQGWDGVFAYTYNHSADFEPPRSTYFFHILARTDVLAHFPACAAMYLRGDVREAQETVVGAKGYPEYFASLVTSKMIPVGIGSAGFDARLGLIHKTAVDLTGKSGTDPAAVKKPEGKVLVSDTGELTWNTERAGEGYWTVNTPNTKVFSGFPAGRVIALGNVALSVGRTRLNWATVSLVSRQATGFGESGKPADILLAATGISQNEGTAIEKLSDTEITFRDRKNWGNGTVLAEGIPATVTLPSDPARTECFALDPRGGRTVKVPVEKAENGGSKIAISPAYRTVWYEIEVK